MADDGITAVQTPATRSLKKLVAWYDPGEVFGVPYSGFVPGVLVTSVILTAITGYWRNASWTLPAALDTMLAAAWGFVMGLETTSQLKALCVTLMVVNVLLFLLVWGFAPPVLGSLAVAGLTQYIPAKKAANGSK